MSTHSRHPSALLLLGAAFLFPSLSWAQGHGNHGEHGEHGKHEHAEAPAAPEFAGDPYLLDTDAATGEKLGPLAKQVVIKVDGREFRFNSQASAQAFRAAPAEAIAKVDAALIRQQLPFYPLTVCPVSGEELGGEMGAPVDVIYRNRLVRLCCKGCKKKLLAKPGPFIAKLDAAVVAAQIEDYPFDTCVVSGEPLEGEMGEPVDYVIGNRLVRLCCKSCKKRVAKDPLGYLAKLGGPPMAEHGDGHGEGHGDGHDHDHGGGHDHGAH